MILERQGEKEVYSDTRVLEQEMLAIAQNYPEDLSQDYIAKDNRYTVNNTFSSVRRNLLNWYHFRENASVLEVGAGMGALTGCLCDSCEQVVALEMSELRAEVIRQRYPKRQNLTVVCEDLFTWNTGQKFDYVIVVGVLEYAAIFAKQYEDPFFAFMHRLKSFLNKDGIVLLAIENRFGLKYWCGAAEDHLCQPFKGIAGYEKEHTAVTFSKADLKKLFQKSGFGEVKFYYVLPDYKFPTLIYADEYEPGASAIQKTVFQYVKGSMLIYDEKKLYREVIENNGKDFFANSFLVEAAEETKLPRQPIYIAGKSECKKDYRISTLIYADGKVEKIPVHEKAKEHLKRMAQYEEQLIRNGVALLKSEYKNGKIVMPYYKGVIAEDYFHELLRQNQMSDIQNLFAQLVNDLKKSSVFVSDQNILWEITGERKDYGPVLKHGYIDMTFSNSFWDKGKLLFFDQEWRLENIPLQFIVFFAVRQSYLSFADKSKITLNDLYRIAHLEHFIDDFILLERHIWDQIMYRQEHFYDGDGWYCEYEEKITLQSKLQEYEICKQTITEKNEFLMKLEKEIKEKNEHILHVENEIEKKDVYILHMEKEIAKKEQYMQELEMKLFEQSEVIRKTEQKLTQKLKKFMQIKR